MQVLPNQIFAIPNFREFAQKNCFAKVSHFKVVTKYVQNLKLRWRFNSINRKKSWKPKNWDEINEQFYRRTCWTRRNNCYIWNKLFFLSQSFAERIWISELTFYWINPFQPSVAFHIEASQFILLYKTNDWFLYEARHLAKMG